MTGAPEFVWKRADGNVWAGVPEHWLRHRVLRVSRLFLFVNRASEKGNAPLFVRQQPPERLSRAALEQGEFHCDKGYWLEPQLSEAYEWHATPWGYEGTRVPEGAPT